MILEALILGLAGSFHCVAMCGPLHLSFFGNKKPSFTFFIEKLILNLGRIFTYIILGILLGYIGKSLPLYSIQKFVSIATGIAILMVYFIPKLTGKELEIPFINRFVIQKMSALMSRTKDKPAMLKLFAMGVLNGLLPCGLVYVALIASFAQFSTIDSMLFMLFFGLGTLPALFVVVLLGGWLKKMLAKFPQLKHLTAVFVFFIALLFILRGSNLGIKYVSPKNLGIEEVQKDPTCH